MFLFGKNISQSRTYNGDVGRKQKFMFKGLGIGIIANVIHSKKKLKSLTL